MKLGTKGRYAVAAMVDLAYYQTQDPMTLTEISARQNLPLPYLEQLFLKLRKAELVYSFRGHTGGYTLARNPQDISIADIIAAVDESLRATGCSEDELGCRGRSSRCQTHHLWENLGSYVDAYLNHISLKDVCEGNLRKAS